MKAADHGISRLSTVFNAMHNTGSSEISHFLASYNCVLLMGVACLNKFNANQSS